MVGCLLVTGSRHGRFFWGALLWAACSACGPGGEGTDAGAVACDTTPDGGLNCDRLCTRYCQKLLDCGVQVSGTSCTEDCRTLLEAGASSSTYTCVVDQPCSDISNCGI